MPSISINKRLLILILLITTVLVARAQVMNVLSGSPDQTDILKTRFVKDNTIQDVDSLYFNVFEIKNPTGRSYTFTPQVNVPAGWAIFSAHLDKITLKSGDSLFIPFRVKLPTSGGSAIKSHVIFTLLSPEHTAFKPGERGRTYRVGHAL